MSGRPAYTEKPWPVIRNALVSLLDQSRPHAIYGLGEADITEALADHPPHREGAAGRGVVPRLHPVLHDARDRRASGGTDLSTPEETDTFEDIDVLTPLDKRLPSGVRIPVGHIVRSARTKSLAADQLGDCGRQ